MNAESNIPVLHYACGHARPAFLGPLLARAVLYLLWLSLPALLIALFAVALAAVVRI